MAYIVNDRSPQHYGHVRADLADKDKLIPSDEYPDYYKCPSCGLEKKPFCLIDIRHVDQAVSGGHKWACDGCWNEWTRPGGTMQKVYNGRPMTARHWLEIHEAPQAVLDRQDNIDIRKLERLEAVGIVSDEKLSLHMDVAKIRLKKTVKERI